MLKLGRETNNYLICHCPSGRHEDKNPSFYILKTDYGHFKKGRGLCWSCGWRAQYSSEFVDSMSKKKTKYREVQPINWYSLALQFCLDKTKRGWPGDLVYEGSSTDFLIGWNGCYTIPMQNEAGEITGIQCRGLDGQKWCIEGSRLGIFTMPMSYKDSKKVVICEGLTDCLVAISCGFFGVGLPSATAGHDIIVKYLINHAVDRIVITEDSDEVGKKSAEKLLKMCQTKSIISRIVSVEPYKDLRFGFEKEGRQWVRSLLGD